MSRILLMVLIDALLSYSLANADDSCKFAEFDLTPLKGTSWSVQTVNGTTKTTYKIRICGEISPTVESHCKDHASVCRYTNFGNATTIGHYTAAMNLSKDEEKGELWLHYQGVPCTERPGDFMKTLINFKCGKTLGSPRFLDSYACDTYFEWHSSVACKTAPKAEKQVQCYVYDRDGKLHDLSPLAKQSGAYKVTSNFYINVCQDIIPDGDTKTCAKGAAACQVTHSQARTLGKPAGGLTITPSGSLYLEYTSDVKPPGCTTNPVTAITFICPKRGGGRDPNLLSAMNCHYDVEWQTEYACAVDYLTTKTCKFSTHVHDIDLDLTPLRNDIDSNTPYKVDVSSGNGGRSYSYFLNVCGDLGIPCPDEGHKKGISACQLDMHDATWGNAIGRSDHQTLRYVDGDLTLMYRGGAPCSNHFQRSTIINFFCNKTASNNGKGEPVFNKEDSCTYIFDWGTKYACLSHEVATECRVDVAGRRYDLSSLVRQPGGLNWEALLGFVQTSGSGSRFFLNMCQDVLRQDLTKGCPDGAAACMRMSDGHGVNLGKFISNPYYDNSTGTIKLHYTDGDTCSNNQKKQSIITLHCKPGDLESGPVLQRKSNDDCLYEFEWETAAACVLSKKTGTDCKVYDDDAGFSFDLSRLTLSGDKAFYEVENNKTNHDYFINVCKPVTGTKCNELKKNETGVCQTDPNIASIVYNTGKASGLLSYFDGMINLTYTNGDSYTVKPPIYRKTEIAFICDQSAGKGTPSFLEETDHTYSFRWSTMYACPEVPIECVITDEKSNKQYDLSSLSKSKLGGNWVVVDDTDAQNRKKYYINVCRPVNPVAVDTGCGAFAAVCQTTFTAGKESMSVTDFGKAKSRPVLEGEGQLVLTYSEGGECTEANGQKKNFTTKIHLRCQKGDLSSGPRFWQQMGKCEVSFLWNTEAACAIEKEETKSESKTEGCLVKDAKSDYVFNLQPLMKKGSTDTYYSVSGASSSQAFKVNICGAVRSSACGKIGEREASVCDGGQGLGIVSDKLELSDDGQLQLKYEGTRLSNGDRTDVLITFICNQAVPMGEPKYVRKDGTTYIFNFETSLACLPKTVDCLVSDKLGNQYDLNPLAKTGTNWMAVDTRLHHSDLKYFINVCRPLNLIAGSSCPGGPVGGCQIDGSGHAFSMGYIQSKPYAAEDGSLSLRYLNGQLCHPGSTHQAHRSTRINFFCAQVEHGPVFQAETEECEYVFNWQTPSACPIQRVVGQDCIVTDPLYHFTFSLGLLHKPATGDNPEFSVTSGSSMFSLNVCHPLHKKTGACSGENGVGACLKQGDKETNIGKANGNLTYEDGLISLKYTGGEKNCMTLITFVCDHKTSGVNGPKFINQTSEGSCVYTFEWPTAFACTPFKSVECTAQDDSGNQYDLTKLTLMNDNYKYSTVLPPHRLFVINVCTTLVHKKGITCPLNSAACKIDLSQKDPKKKYVSLGQVDARPLRLENGQLLLVYEHGQICKNTSGQVNYMRTFIHLKCDKTALDSQPVYTFTSDECDYHFLWMTQAACPINSQTPAPSGSCTVVNPVTGYEFSLSSLKGQTYQVNYSIKQQTYGIRVCEPDAQSACGTDSGCCIQNLVGSPNPINLGSANSQLHFNDGILTLNYTSKTPCPNQAYLMRSTIITFVCGAPGSGKGKPVFIGDTDDCSYYFSWHTELACEKQLYCAVQNKSQIIDLSPLIKKEGRHNAIPGVGINWEPGTSYDFNICRPLNPIPGVLCPPESAACKRYPNQAPQSLGRLHNPPFIDAETHRVTLVYDHGVACKNDASKKTSSRISFVCVPGASQGRPVLEAITKDCEYIFTWGTNVVCPDATPVTSSKCSFTDSKTKYTYDFSSLTNVGGKDYEVKGSGDDKFLLNVCGTVKGSQTPQCQGAAVCQVNARGQETVFGMSSSLQFIKEGETVKMSYLQGTSCTGSKMASAHVIFGCDREVSSKGAPTLFARGACEVVFSWMTPLACQPIRRDCVFADGAALYDLHLLSRENSSWSLTDKQGNQYWLNLCQGIRQSPSPSDCPVNAAVCRKADDGTIVALGSVDTQQMYMDADGKTIIVKYSKGSRACAKENPNSDSASVVIKFTCGNTVGGPLFIPRKQSQNSCVFEFEWKSSIACKEERKEVFEKNGMIVDPRVGANINMKLIHKSLNYQVVEVRGEEQLTYQINLDGLSTPGPCQGAAVCLTKASDHSSTPLATTATAKFYLQDDNLELIYTSDTVCDTDQSTKASVLIEFHCSGIPSQPTFNYRTIGCEHIFDWYTPGVCVTPNVVNTQPVSGGDKFTVNKNGGQNGGNTGTIVAVLVLFVVVTLFAVGLIYFHKPERRIRFKQSVRAVFRKDDTSARYSVISSLDDDDPLLNHIMADEEEELGGDAAAMATTATTATAENEDQDKTKPDKKQKKARRKKKEEKTDKEESKHKAESRDSKTKEEEVVVKPYHDDSDEDLIF